MEAEAKAAEGGPEVKQPLNPNEELDEAAINIQQ